MTVTDHALLRYLERVIGFDFSLYRDALARRAEVASVDGAASISLDGHVFVIEDGRVITVLPEGGRPKRRRKR